MIGVEIAGLVGHGHRGTPHVEHSYAFTARTF
jgi:hypothetical protein